MQFLTEDIITCRICDAKLTKNSLSPHLRTAHNKMSSKDYYNAYLKKEGEGLCLTCGKPTKYQTLFKGYKLYCSDPRCSQQSFKIKQKIKQIRLQKNGGEWVKDYKQKYTDTCLERYGYSSANTDEQIKKKKEQTRRTRNKGAWYTDYKSKYKKTCLDKHGVDSTNQIEEVKQKKEQTSLEHYGVKSPMQSEIVKQKIRENFLRKRLPLVIQHLKSKDLELLTEYTYSQDSCDLLCKKCNTIFETNFFNIQCGYGRCPKCYPKYGSIAETEIRKFLEDDLNFEIQIRDRNLIKPYELDIYIPSKKFAVEYNGIYYHSEKCGKDSKYHLNKLNLCTNLDITLIQIFEDEWLCKRDLVKSRLAQLLGASISTKIHARKCTIKEIACKQALEFIDNHHLQGRSESTPINLGAFLNNELVAVMTFNHGSCAKGVKHPDALVWELVRFCCNSRYNIRGIASKLLTYFKNNYQWKIIYSYADRRWSKGALYTSLGFILTRTSRPNYWYVDKGKRIYRFRMRKQKCHSKDTPEWAIRLKEGLTRIWDCGNLRFELQNKKA